MLGHRRLHVLLLEPAVAAYRICRRSRTVGWGCWAIVVVHVLLLGPTVAARLYPSRKNKKKTLSQGCQESYQSVAALPSSRLRRRSEGSWTHEMPLRAPAHAAGTLMLQADSRRFKLAPVNFVAQSQAPPDKLNDVEQLRRARILIVRLHAALPCQRPGVTPRFTPIEARVSGKVLPCHCVPHDRAPGKQLPGAATAGLSLSARHRGAGAMFGSTIQYGA